MRKITHFLITLLLTSCATFDQTNILPHQRVNGLGFSFAVPTEKPWFAVEYGTSHRIKLSQLNNQDSYSILVSLNRPPYQGMYQSAKAHLKSIQIQQYRKQAKPGYIQHTRNAWIESKYGDLCISYTTEGEDWHGRNNEGPALVYLIGLSCPHPSLSNVLITIDLSRRAETSADDVDLVAYAEALFSSFEYTTLD